MEGSSSQPSDSDRKPPAAAASFLANLPSRGLFSSTVSSSNPGGMRVYVCEHDTSPPANQRIKTNLQNILIRSLTLKKRGDSSSKDGRAADKKRPAERVLDSRTAAKRANAQTSSQQEGANSCTVERDYHSLTVERLRSLLKGKGLSVKGKKDELIARLRNASG